LGGKIADPTLAENEKNALKESFDALSVDEDPLSG